MEGAVFRVLLVFLFIEAISSQVFAPFALQGEFTGCWSVTGLLNAPTFISVGPVTIPAPGTLPINAILLPLPPDPTPNVIAQDPNSLLIKMGTLTQLTRNQLCNGFNAPPFPGTSAVAAPGQKAFSGFYGSTITVTGQEQILPECTPPGIPGVICDPTKALKIVDFINVIIAETLLSGFLTPPTDPRATFNINNIPSVPIIYNNLLTGLSITATVIDQFGFQVVPTAVPTQGQAVAQGWFSLIAGENLYYYFQTQVTAGIRLPNQLIGISLVKCVVASGALSVRGGVSTAIPGLSPLSWGTVDISDPFTNTLITTVTPIDVVVEFPTGSWTARANLNLCPRTIRVTWNIPAGLAVAPGLATIDVQTL